MGSVALTGCARGDRTHRPACLLLPRAILQVNTGERGFVFAVCMIPPKRFDIFVHPTGGCSEGQDTFIFLNNSSKEYYAL